MKKHLPTHLLLFVFLYLGALGEALAQYCVPTHPSGCGNGDITLVRITGTTLNSVSSCGNSGYTVWPGQGSTTAVLRQNSGYAFNVTSSGSYVTVWVDWDQNQSFDDTETLIYGLSSPVASGFIVPSSARTGQTRMRVRSRQTSSTIAACGSQASGETEDYIVTVVAGQVPTVCLPFNYSACSDGNITRVSLTGTGLDNSSGCSTDSAGNAYTIWPKQGSRTGVVRQGQSYSMDISAGNAYVGLWVDWDQSNSFESSEQILFGPNAPVNYWLSVPANAATGTTRMRVRTRTNSSTVNTCGLSATGETEDYFLTVIAGQSPIPCTPGHYNGCGNGDITRVQIVGSGLDKSSNCSVDTAGNAYTVWPATGSQTGTVRMGSTYAFKVNAGNTYVGAWADWDQSGTFETTEQILYGANAPVAGYLAVPSNARAGQVRLRIRTRISSSTLSACSNYSEGEAEDYFLTVIPGSAPTPCTPGHYSGCAGGAITRVKITGTTLDNSSACTEDTAGNAYTIWPATGTKTGLLRQGTTYAFSISAGASYIGVWADWNQNDVFETNEQIVYGVSSPFVGYLPVPTDALPGRVRMRVRSYQSSSTLSPCANYGSGEAEDYFVTVIAGTAPATCTPGHFSGCSTGSITRVSLTGTTLNNTSSCSTDTAGNAYTVWPATGNRTGIVRQGTTYGFQATAPGATVFVWADWNGNDVFENSEYLIATGSPVLSYLAVPTDAAVGQVRIRVRSSTTTSSLTACGYTSTGEAEDYFVTVVAGQAPSPCTPGHYSGCSSGTITRVSMTGTSLNSISTCSVDSTGNAYTVWPATGSHTGIVRQGTTYAFQATAAGATVFVWVDWNSNEVFESGEYMISASSPVTSYISVPTDAQLGQVRMRVRSSTTTSSLSACGFTASGETEEYVLTVVAGAAPSPCVPGHYSGCGVGNLTRVKLTGSGLDNSSTCLPDTTGNAYIQWPATGTRTGIVRQGTTYGFQATASGSYIAAWVDWNNNSVFESTEYMIAGSSPISSYIAVPTNAALGLVRMRVRSNQNVSSMSACGAYSTGETEDYFLTVVAGAAPTVCTPINYAGCGPAYVSRVAISNSGLDQSSTCSEDSSGNAYKVWPISGTSSGTIRQNQSYTLTATATSSGWISVWIDWNQDGTFASSELIGSSSNGSLSRAVTIPANAPSGYARMRVRSSASGSFSSSCNSVGQGETEDYWLAVINGPICNTGVFSYNISGVLCAGSNVVLTPQFTAFSSAANFSAIPAGLALNAATGEVQVQNSQPGTYTVRNIVTAAGNCAADTGYATVSIVAQASAGFTYGQSTYCRTSGSDPVPTITGTPGGVFSAGAGLAINAQTGRISLANSVTGSYTVRYDITGTCAASSSVNITLTDPATASFVLADSLCTSRNTFVIPLATGSTRGAFSAVPTGLSLTAGGSLDLGASQPGQYTVTNTVTGTAGCANATDSHLLTVVRQSTSSFSYGSGSYCRSVASASATVTGTAGGRFSATPAGLSLNAVTGEISPATSTVGTYVVRYQVGGLCPSSSSVNITITSAATSSFTIPPTACTYDGNIIAQPGPGSVRGVFSAQPNGLSIDANGSISPSTSVPGRYVVTNTVAGGTGCPNSVSTDTIEVFAEPTVTISVIGSESFCQGDSAKLVASGANSYVWSTGATTPTIIVRSTGAFQVQGRGAGGCVGIRGQRIDVFTRPATPVITLTGGGTSLTSNATTGNQWLLNGQPIAGATGQTYTIPANGSGTYSSLVRDGNGCDSDTSNTIAVVVSGVAGRQQRDWQFYPNPSEGRVQIAAPSRMQGELALYDALGRNVYDAVLAGQDSYELHLEHLPKGVYQAMMRTAAGVQTYRITLR